MKEVEAEEVLKEVEKAANQLSAHVAQLQDE